MSAISDWLRRASLATALCLMPWLALAAEKPQEIRIAVPDISATKEHAGGGVVDVLRQQHILEDAFAADGIKIDWLFFKGAGPAVNEALANGQADFAYFGDLPGIISKASGLDTRLLAAITRNVKLYLGVKPGSPIRRLEDLKGKRVAIFRGTVQELSLARVLASKGLKETDLRVINLDFNASTAALAAGQIDASWGFSNLTLLKQKGLAEIVQTTDDLGGVGTLQAVLVGTGKFVKQYPDITRRLLEANRKGADWLRDSHNKQAFLELFARLTGYPKAILDADYGAENLADIFNPALDEAFTSQLQKSVDLAAQLRLTRKPFPVKDWVWSPSKETVSRGP